MSASRLLALAALMLGASSSSWAQDTVRSAEEWAERIVSVRSIVAGDADWTPDGARILFRSGASGSTGLWSVAAGGGDPTLLTDGLGGAPFQMAVQPTVSPAGDWIAYVSDRGAPAAQPGSPKPTDIWLWSPTDGASVRLTHLDTRIGEISWSPDGSRIAFSAALHGANDIFTVTVPDGELRRLTSDSRYENSPVWSPDGRHIVYVLVDDEWVDHDIVEIPAEGGAARLIVSDRDFFDYRTAGTPNFGRPLLSPDGRTVVFRSWRSGWVNYWTVPRDGGEPRPLAAESWDQSEAAWSPDGSAIAWVTNRNGTHALTVVTVANGVRRDLVSPEPGTVSAPRWSPDGRRILYALETPTSPADLHVADVATGDTRRLTESRPDGWLADELVAPEKISYPSGDLTIHAYLFRPRGLRPRERAPVLLFAHGGPTSQYVDSFNQQMQFFAGQGYVVVAPNFRGGSGYGREFADLNDRRGPDGACWSRCDVADLAAAVDYLRAEVPWADPARVGVTGTSHGGLMAMGAATHFPGVFRATIAHGGTADRIYYYQTQEKRHIRQARDEFGPLDGNEDAYVHVSPFYAAEQVNTPIMVIWGEGEWPGSQNSARYVQQLERFYKTHRVKVYQGENYYVSGRENTRRMLLDMLDFLEQYLRGSGADGTAAVAGGS